MTKPELLAIFEALDIPYHEGIQYMDDNTKYPQIVFFEYTWEDEMASGNNYTTTVSYQISFRSMKPRDRKLLELKKLLNNNGIHPIIQHEYIESKREWHSFFPIEVNEDVCAEL